ncbi:Ig-like domain-containing protein [Faecalispora sporosphaeroides]|uniref:Ig-like domain-containing protein n=1 Tax=Faecalispora sporosphaeroides TaxID=1549 RepID=UPI0003A5754F|nr:Ig-like domain-containing protein [Faecalispora sporosphaeroides]
MKRDRKTSFILTLMLLFMFSIFGGGTILNALGIIQIPLFSSSENTTVSSDTINNNNSESPGINIPTGIRIYDPQSPVSSQIGDPDTESSISGDIRDTSTEKDYSYVAELAGGTGTSGSSSADTSSITGQEAGNSSSSSAPAPADPGTSSGSASDNSSSSSSSSGGTVIPGNRPKPSGGGGSHAVDVQSIVLDQSDVTINRKNTLQLTATIAPQNATTKTVTWTTSNKDVADVDSSGKVTGIGAGTVTITATAGQKSATCQVTVVVLMDGISLNHTELSIDKGSTEQLTAKITPEDTTDDKTITWTSSDSEIVSVDDAGKVTALKPGKATVKASAVGASASCEVTVLSPMTGIELDKSTLTLNRNTTDKLTISFLPDDTTSGREVAWSSSAPEVANVDQQGNVVGYSIGTTTVTARCGEFTATCNVTVNALIDGVYLDQSEMTLDRGTDGQLKASIVPLDTTEDKTVTWSSNDPNVAAVDDSGKVTGVKIGSATITAKVGEHTASCKINVVALIHSIALDKTELTLDRGTGDQLTVNIDPPDTTEDKTVTWSSTDPDVATVDSSGIVFGVKIGTATITAKVGTHTASCSVTVVALIHSIALDKTELTLDRGTGDQLTVNIDPPDTTEDKTITWTSSNPDVAIVDAAGKVTGVKIGSATITAQVGTHTARCTINVVALIHNIALDKTELTLNRGTTGQLIVGIDPPDTTENKTVTWSSSDPTVATVDASGKVTAVQIGSATITATVGTHACSCNINVVALIKSIALDQSALIVDRGTSNLIAVLYDPADTTEDKTVAWSSSDPDVATVDSTGKVTGVKIGTATITAKVGTHTASCSVTVVALIHSITLDKTELTLDRGTGDQLTVNIDPPDTTEDKTVVWSSSDPSVATVDSSGKVTGVKIGSAIITAKVGAHTALCNVNVVALIHNISLDKSYLNPDKGATDQLTVSFDPVDTTESKVVIWTSSNPAIATVDATGKVTAGISQVGETIITARVGTHTATCVVGVGVKFTVTTEEKWTSSGMDMRFYGDGSGRFAAWENDKKEKHGYGELKITFSRAITIPTNNQDITITLREYDEDGSASSGGHVNLYYPGTNTSSFSLSNNTRSWRTTAKDTTYVHLHFSSTVRANSKESGYVGVTWQPGDLVIFGIPITSSSGYLDL